MKEAIRIVLEFIYDPEFPDTSHFRSGRGCHSVLRRIKEEWGTSRWFLEFDIRKCFHTIDRHRRISIFKEEIDDPKFFYSIHKVFSAGRLVGGEKGPYSIPHSVLLSALPRNIYSQARSGDREDPTEPSSLLCAAFLVEAAGLTPKAEFCGAGKASTGKASYPYNCLPSTLRHAFQVEVRCYRTFNKQSHDRALMPGSSHCILLQVGRRQRKEGDAGRDLPASEFPIQIEIRWSAIFTLVHKHKSSARNIIPKYSKDSNIVNQEGGKTLAEFPNSIELGKLESGQDPNNKGALHY
ncbi:OLC1v1016313C1 [Oldenlandia corymbosa var. corymbosa]|uniref:OLC1v1016313C1 n=1 Tax=Oldenlandia corymbosa var. corymbosa TaxID=529605 RepID=A0AAV1E7D1_OLDCO|nr:OLC1v1016313C1 [Oldenlandia corymbosa var. corymbosa]